MLFGAAAKLCTKESVCAIFVIARWCADFLKNILHLFRLNTGIFREYRTICALTAVARKLHGTAKNQIK